MPERNCMVFLDIYAAFKIARLSLGDLDVKKPKKQINFTA
jgi:hypothetical protein